MWFTLLTVDKPADADVQFLSEVYKSWVDLTREENRFNDLNQKKFGKVNDDGAAPGEQSNEARQENLKHTERNQGIADFCKLMICNQKMTQEICRLIIYLTSKNV